MKYLLGVFTFSFFLSAPYLIDICSGYLGYYNFDLQEFLLWNYTSLASLIPYKDIFYPYGLLSYFRNYNAVFSLIYYLIPPILFAILFFIFKKNFKDRFTLYTSFVLFYVFILISNGFQTFSRYGLLAVFSLLFSYIFYSNNKIKAHLLIYCGVLLGLLLSAVNDQGVYVLFSFIFMFLLSKYFHAAREHFLYFNLFAIIKEAVFAALGFFVGIVPLFLFLLYHNSFNAYFNHFKDLGEIVAVSKTPFFSFADSPANIFTISILYFAIFYNTVRMLIFKHKLTLSSFFQISLIFTILVMEQKSIIRSIDRQIVFVSFILLMFLVHNLINFLKIKNVNKKILYTVVILTVLIAYSFKINQTIDFSNLFRNYSFLINNKCFDSNLKFFLTNNPSYIKIINLLKKQDNFNGKIFSFPTGDSAFYVLLKQKPPFYNAIFEGASYEKQKNAIKYVEDNKIEFITLNMDESSLQDGVPDYVRQNELFRYILSNYQPLEIIGGHIILKKTQNNDFFTSKILKQRKDYENYLLNVYLYKIPYSEGLYKYNYLKSNNKLIVEGNVGKISSFLTENKLVSRDKVIVLIPNKNNKKQSLSFVKLKTENEHSATIYYNSCHENEVCIINLSRILLFYEDRLITKLNFGKQYSGKIEIFNVKNPGNLW